jgi:hypothetical protein
LGFDGWFGDARSIARLTQPFGVIRPVNQQSR